MHTHVRAGGGQISRMEILLRANPPHFDHSLLCGILAGFAY